MSKITFYQMVRFELRIHVSVFSYIIGIRGTYYLLVFVYCLNQGVLWTISPLMTPLENILDISKCTSLFSFVPPPMYCKAVMR